jgi:hypothetical protein
VGTIVGWPARPRRAERGQDGPPGFRRDPAWK